MSEENERLYEAAQRRLREVTTLYEASQACLSISDQKGLLTAIIETAARATDATWGSVMLIDEEKGEYIFGAHYGLSEETIATIEAELHIPVGEGLTGAVVTTGQPLVVADVRTDPRWIPVEVKEPMCSFLGVPLLGRDGQPLGALTLSHPEVGAFDEDHARLLSTFANQAALAIENVRLYEQAQQEITERKRALEALRESEERYRRLVELSFDAIAIHREGKVVYINAAGAELFGASSPEELFGKPILDFVHPDHLEIVKERMLQVTEGRVAPLIEEKLIRLDGTSVDAEVVGIPITYQGQPAVQVVVRDITERKQAEEAYRTLVEHSLQGLVIIQDLGVVFANLAIAEMLGYTIEELMSLSPEEVRAVVHPEDQAFVWGRYRDRLEGKPVPPRYEFRMMRKDGTVCWVEMFSSRIEYGGKPAVQAAFVDITERKRAEEALRETNARLQTLVQAIPDVVYFKDAQGRNLVVNRAFEELVGLKQAEIVGKTDEQLLPPDLAEYCRQSDEEVMRSRKPLRFEEQSTGEDGEKIFFDTIKAPFYDDQGNAVGVVGVSRDITERKWAEKALRESEERYRQSVENSPNPIFSVDKQGIIQTWNRACEQLFQYRSEEVIGLVYHKLLWNPEDRPDVEAMLAQVWQGHSLSNEDMTYRCKDGARRFMVSRLYPLRDHEGSVQGCVLANTDITERKRAEEALRESEEKFRTLFDNASDAIFIHDLEGHFLEVNQVACERLGYSREELLQMTPMDIDSPEYAALVLERITELRQRGHVFFKTAHMRRDGTTIPIELSSRIIEYAGRPAVLSIARDITERRRLEEQLRQAQKMEAIGTLAGGIAHDFNNLLTPIGGFAELLLWKAREGSRQHEYLRQIKVAAERAAALTRQLLTFARRGRVEVRPLSLNTVVYEVIELLERTIDKAIAIEPYLADDLATVEGDASQLHQMLLNLCLNARDAMPQGGRLIIETQNVTLSEAKASTELDLETGQYVLLSVTDTGIGMDAEIQQHLFEPFFTTKEQGRGLGLAMAYGIVRGHGGTIHVYSELGQGSTFKVYLPVAGRLVEDITPEEVEVLGGTETVLVVDDEEPVRTLLQRILEGGGYTVLLATDGVEAVELYTRLSTEIDLVVLDIIMPRMGGRRTYERLREINPEVKVLLSSGYSENGQARDILVAGARGFLQKPYDLRAVLHKVRQVLGG